MPPSATSPSIRVLLYSPNLSGHPQVYCRVIADILLEHGATIVIATAETDDWARRWPDIGSLAARTDVQVVSVRPFSGSGSPHLRAEELCRLQEHFRIDSTLFIEAEFFRDEFVRIAQGEAGRLRGYNAGIYGATTRWYPGEEFYSGRSIGLLDGNLRQKLGTLKRLLLSPWTIDRYFFENYLIERRLLDAVIVKDERLAARYEGAVHWLPEIYRVFDATESDEEKAEYNTLKPELDGFLKQHDPDDILLFFGAGAWYKGYDYFIQLLLDDPTAVGVHIGSGIRYDNGKTFVGDPESGKRDLVKQGRLYETKKYVQSTRLINEAYGCTRRFVSTHRLTVSSGTMLQALELGLPVLVPESGLIGYRTRRYGLGLTYKYGDSQDLLRKWRSFRQEPLDAYREPIRDFMRKFGRAHVESLLRDTLLGCR
jgi:hypothetical protein